jgi:hypothetical protein
MRTEGNGRHGEKRQAQKSYKKREATVSGTGNMFYKTKNKLFFQLKPKNIILCCEPKIVSIFQLGPISKTSELKKKPTALYT